jgi:ketosteroid isomerase-like protein
VTGRTTPQKGHDMSVDSATTREANKQTLRRAMSAISVHDIDTVGAELHESAAFVMPFQADLPDCDRTGYLQLLAMMFVMFEKLELTITHIYDLVDPNTLVARWRVDGVYRLKPVVYENEYIGVMHFRDRKIVSWRGYANPEAAHAALAKLAEDAPAVSP